MRNLVDDLAKQKSKSELEAKQIKDDIGNTKSKLGKREQENRNLQRKIDSLEKDLLKYKQDHEAYQVFWSLLLIFWIFISHF